MTGLQASKKSKSFRAVLPRLSEGELERLRFWGADFCSSSAVWREGDNVVWLASKERARSREGFMRSLRNTLDCLAIAAKPKGRWLILAEESAVRSEARKCALTAARPLERSFVASAAEEPGDDKVVVLRGIDHAPLLWPQRGPAEPTPATAMEEPGDRIILLRGTARGSPAGSMQVFKEE